MSDVTAVEQANDELYAAFEAGDLDRMAALWVDGDEAGLATCIHPGGAAIRGIDAVLRSWALIMANTENVQFIVPDAQVLAGPDSATVTCTEIILRPGDDVDPFRSSHAIATNGFIRIDDRWRLWLHHASPVMVASDAEEDQ